jgi:uncharacterized protein YydD (DUF2326 family)
MFLKSLIISTPTKVIREIPFHKGINLIVDESEEQITGNNVGKTTLLRLIDFCLGADAKAIYIDPDINSLNEVKYALNSASSEIASLNLRKSIILDAKQDFESQKSDMDTHVLGIIYRQAAALIPNLQRKFEELVAYHNQMLIHKINFITQDLPLLESKIQEKNKELVSLLFHEQILSEKITQSDTFEELESIIRELNDLFKKKGEYENVISQLSEAEANINELNAELKEIDERLFSPDFESIVKSQLKKFNRFFGDISNRLYGEQYAITYSITTNRQGHKLYTFSSFNVNHSSGKKQGEISCFDIAYTLFADKEKIACLHFLLNDKKELVHDNQLIKIAEIVNNNNIQFVASILKDKLPAELNKEQYFVVKLSQNDKLFRISG